ncbi:DUF6199 family natural product biosynthesis protein [Paenibacillus faecalis]|uniref:DUF6199 family natural product biosynthesis protein n=1 Tax=Paenibacillus faecalis TaxID=2079532 RepID=UPI000D0F336A|nr:DUF6199 family natural product biosynthesis protein [Paenibacillus faecalis]
MNGFLLLFIAIILIGFGIWIRKKPDFGWQFNEGWKVNGDSEPSYAYLEWAKFGGLITICLGSIFLVFGLMTIFL